MVPVLLDIPPRPEVQRGAAHAGEAERSGEAGVDRVARVTPPARLAAVGRHRKEPRCALAGERHVQRDTRLDVEQPRAELVHFAAHAPRSGERAVRHDSGRGMRVAVGWSGAAGGVRGEPVCEERFEFRSGERCVQCSLHAVLAIRLLRRYLGDATRSQTLRKVGGEERGPGVVGQRVCVERRPVAYRDLRLPAVEDEGGAAVTQGARQRAPRNPPAPTQSRWGRRASARGAAVRAPALPGKSCC